MFNKEEFNPENIFAGSTMPVVTDSIILAAGQETKILSVLYLDETTKQCFTKTTESKEVNVSKIYALSAEENEELISEKEIPVYFTGEFNKAAIVLPDGESIDDYVYAFRSKGIFLK